MPGKLWQLGDQPAGGRAVVSGKAVHLSAQAMRLQGVEQDPDGGVVEQIFAGEPSVDRISRRGGGRSKDRCGRQVFEFFRNTGSCSSV